MFLAYIRFNLQMLFLAFFASRITLPCLSVLRLSQQLVVTRCEDLDVLLGSAMWYNGVQ